jgi:hypothetical protein
MIDTFILPVARTFATGRAFEAGLVGRPAGHFADEATCSSVPWQGP